MQLVLGSAVVLGSLVCWLLSWAWSRTDLGRDFPGGGRSGVQTHDQQHPRGGRVPGDEVPVLCPLPGAPGLSALVARTCPRPGSAHVRLPRTRPAGLTYCLTDAHPQERPAVPQTLRGPALGVTWPPARRVECIPVTALHLVGGLSESVPLKTLFHALTIP